MAALSTLLDRIHDEFPAVPEAMALRALSDSVKEFCTRTHAWQETLPRVSLREGTAVYELYPDTGLQIIALKDVRLDGARLTPSATERVRLRRTNPADGLPTAFIQVTPTTIELDRAPHEAARVTVRAAMTLALGATEVDVPETLLDEHGEAFAMGAKMRLVKQASQPWFAPDMAPMYALSYYTAVTVAKGRAMFAMGEADMQIEMRSW